MRPKFKSTELKEPAEAVFTGSEESLVERMRHAATHCETMYETDIEILRQRVIAASCEAERLRDENSRLQKALAEIEKADAKAMYVRCPDCDYSECDVTKRCKGMPNSPIGKMAVEALKTPNAQVTGAAASSPRPVD